MNEHDPLGVVGQRVADKYLVQHLVGEGGFASVYRAEHTIWKQPVAIKFFSGLASAPAELREPLREAFIQEGSLLTQLSSQNTCIVQARDTGVHTSERGAWLPFMVLEWLEGASLAEVLESERRAGGGRFPLSEVLRLLGPIAQALDLAHGHGIAHRDVKPDNLFVLGGNLRRKAVVIKLLDFGVAKLMAANAKVSTLLTKTGTSVVPFTPNYGAPEQYSRHFGATGPWTDVFSLALVAVELLSGQSALGGEDLAQLGFASTDRSRRPTPRALGVEVSDALEAVFARALAVDPEARPARAGAFWAELEAAAGPRAPAPAGSTLLSSNWTRPPSGKAPGHRRAARAWIAGGAALAALGAVAALGHDHWQETPAPPTLAATAALAAQPPPTPAPEPLPPACPADMALIPAGQFFQGSEDGQALANEQPSHAVELSAYCIDLHEVTAAQYAACSDVGRCKRAADEVDWPDISEHEHAVYSELCTRDAPGKQDHPINCVTWEMAALYCATQGKRLPSEAEWEYAARGPDGRIYPWGDEEPSAERLNACGAECTAWGQANEVELKPLYAADDGYPATAPVGHFPAGRSRYGLYDVTGNVWEWVGDWYADYSAAPQTDPTGPAAGQRKVIRGGAWNGSYATWLRPSFRYAQDPKALSHGIGFRCAQPLAPRGTAAPAGGE